MLAEEVKDLHYSHSGEKGTYITTNHQILWSDL